MGAHGAALLPDGRVRFRLWAPAHAQIGVLIEGEAHEMDALADGWHELVTDQAHPGTRYRFRLPDGSAVPDPASRFQPDDVHGPSVVTDPHAYAWQDQGWVGRAWEQAVICELHVGSFTPEGSFRAAIARLDHLADLGVTAIELMPIADFPGRWNWGYDGVLLYAPDASYGTPDDLKALVDAAHQRGLMVLLDVVYNHFGPDGNYLSSYAPQFFTDRHQTPWGAAVNYDGAHSAAVRDFVIGNAVYWVTEFHLDGLRLDAVHAIVDDSETHLLEELAARVRDAAGGRLVHLVLENEENHAAPLQRGPDGAPQSYTAQWNDDLHHVLHVAATGEDAGYYSAYHGDTPKLARALAEGFAFQGEVMEYRGTPRGEPSAKLPPSAFVAFIQNHDQIGNRAFGERIGAIAPEAAVRAIAATYLLLPQVPMLFMGEEWNAAQPFPFFCDFEGELADAIRNGRRAEFAKFPEFRDEAMRARIPDPLAAATFAAAKLDWSDLEKPAHAAWHDWYRRVLAVRHAAIVPLLAGMGGYAGSFQILGEGAVVVRWRTQATGEQGEGALTLAATLSAVPVEGFPAADGEVIWQEGSADADGNFGPWAVRWSVERGPGLQASKVGALPRAPSGPVGPKPQGLS